MKTSLLIIAAGALACATAPAAAAVMPFGVQTNVLKSTVTNDWGWSQCFQQNYGNNGTSLTALLAGCNGNYLMMAASDSSGSLNFTVLAAAAKSDVTFNTGDNNNTTHNANGVEWYFSNSWSWGFAPDGANVSRNSCDTADSSFGVNGGDGTTGDKRLCWHTGNGTLNGGWRAGTADSLNGNSSYQRYLFVADSLDVDVPEPAMLGLFGLGALGLGLARRRKA